MRREVIIGDCLEAMRGMADASVDSVVCDPPYDLTAVSRGGSPRVAGSGPFGRHTLETKGFMGEAWDGTGVAFRAETWAEVFRVLKDGGRLLAFGGPRTYHRMACAVEDGGFLIEDCIMWIFGQGFPKHRSKLKPAYEPVVVARKGGASHLNIDACRVVVDPERDASQLRTMNRAPRAEAGNGHRWGLADGDTAQVLSPDGRWPANVVLDEEAAAALDEQSGELKSGRLEPHHNCGGWGYSGGNRAQPTLQATGGDSGGASRFFYTAKASRSERGDGNTHPTVKPVELMRWLCRLVTPPGGLVLDPFAGSGSTGVACVREGFSFVGVEREADYAEIARRRIAAAEEDETQSAPLLILTGAV